MKFINKQTAEDYSEALQYRLEALRNEIEELKIEEQRLVESCMEAAKYVEDYQGN